MHQNNLIPSGAVAVTKSDTTMVNFCGLYVSGTGDLSVVGGDGQTVVLAAVPAGFILPMQVTKVLAATTATGIVGFVA